MRTTILLGSMLSGLMLASCLSADDGHWGSAPSPPHLVLRPHVLPRSPLDAMHHGGAHPSAAHHEGQLVPAVVTDHVLKKNSAYVTGPRAAISPATTELRQRVPYSYGYFGAQEKRHASLHYGVGQNFKRWSWR